MADALIHRRETKCPFIEPPNFPTTNGCPFNPSADTVRWTSEKSIELHNYQTNDSNYVSGPHSNSYQDCRHGVCTSTFMSLPAHPGDSKSAELQSHSREYIRKEAYDFLAIYRQDKTMSDEDYDKRLEQIDVDIHNTGVYQLTTQELEYGCQLAWRNAARCINRLFWSSLKVIDRRHVNTNDQMFAEICDHIREAYNKGTLQATTLVLGRESRMWSTQYFRFACYEQEDGSMLGDPANRELTKVAMELGWNKPQKQRTQWDLLPIIVQVDQNTPPSWYELPEDLRLIVFLSHPDAKYDAAIKKLGLRWVVQPFVADKAIEIGGIVFKCVPFSGWFMGTEIGRNLCDVQRYNFIPKIAALLDLDITAAANSQLNVDRIYIEINAAVLHSFQRAKIAIVDHHTAATGFIKFMKQEVKQRGNTPADWVWLVPPVSSGMSVVFHQEMLNYVVKPRVLDQRDPWTYYTGFRRAKETSQTSSTVKRRHRWTLLHAARSIIGLALRAAKKRVAVHVLYASASGTAQSYAQQMSKRLAMDGYQTTLMMLDKYPFRQATDTRALVLIITSTFGQGNAPEGGTEMEEWLKDEMREVDENNNHSDTILNRSVNGYRQLYQPTKSSLRWCTYAVCAIGSSAYPFFCGFGKLIDQTFRTLGAHQLVPLATCDALNQQYKSFNEWEETTVMTLKKMYPHVTSTAKVQTLLSPNARPKLLRLSSYIEEQVQLNKSVQPSFITLRYLPKSDEIPSSTLIGPFTKENPYKAVVLQNIELTGNENATHPPTSSVSNRSEGSASGSPTSTKRLTIPALFTNVNNDEYRSVRRIKLETPGLSFYPGDHVCILPENTLANVNAIIVACGWQLRNKLLNEPCSLGSLTNNQYITLRQLLIHHVDLVTTPRPHLLDTFATYATNTTQQRQLFELGKGGQRYIDWCVNLPTIKEMLDQYPSVRIPLEELIQLLPPLQPRYYSVSSSNSFTPNELDITVSVVSYTTPHGVVRKGICSNYLQQTVPALAQDGQKIQTAWQRKLSIVRLFVSPKSHFRLPGQESLTSALTPTIVSHGDPYLPLNTPLLMLAIGSGIAPFRSFWQELQVLERRQGSVPVERVLFMGCRSPNDFLYANELRGLTSTNNRNDKLLTAVIPVYSRENAGAKRYIQDAILEHDQMVYSMLTEGEALIYMCGSTRSCQGLEAALGSVIQSCASESLTQMEAMDVIKQLKESGRIRQDMFG